MIGKAVKEIIDSELADIFGDRLYPIAADADGLPSIYYKVGCTPDSYKNGPGMNDWKLELITMFETYAESWDAAARIRIAFEKNARATVAGIRFQKISCTSIVDDYEFQVGSFGQVITFEIRTT